MHETPFGLLSRHLHDARAQWSIGTFGAIAEFARDDSEPVELLADDARIAAVTARGGIALNDRADMRLAASESLTRESWSQRVALCLPHDACAMAQRSVLTRLGPDADALREADRDGILFDLGLGVRHADFCVRMPEGEAATALAACEGRSVFKPGNPAMGIIFGAQPHRVFISRLGRAEVYQPIPHASGVSPDGPHTHLLPKLLRAGRTHAATEQIPDGYVPCAHLYPVHPAKDVFGRPRPFETPAHDAFQALLRAFGPQDAVDAKERVAAAVAAGAAPFAPDALPDRFTRASARIALRQMKAAGGGAPALAAWLAAFERDSADAAEIEDAEANPHG